MLWDAALALACGRGAQVSYEVQMKTSALCRNKARDMKAVLEKQLAGAF